MVKALSACFLASAAASSSPDLLVQIDTGKVQGILEDDVRKFLGVPFAADTGGANRFLAPQPRAPWTDTWDASKYGPGCEQGGPSSHNPDIPAVQSEDCLNVNIFAPTETQTLVPVMLWFHGGAFKEGSNQGPFALYDGHSLVKQHNVLIVSANYRMHSLGWLSLAANSGTGIRGNMGLLDQRVAMEWVQRNAKVFGGDPSQVTLWGESAGAMSIGCHMATPSTSGLYSSAIMESNVAGFRYRTADEAATYGNYFLEELPACTTLKGSDLLLCLQNQTVQDIRHAASAAESRIWDIVKGNWYHWLSAVLTWTPVVDGKVLPGHPQEVFSEGKQVQVPLLAGTNSAEGATFIYDKGFPAVSGLELEAALPVIFGKEDGAKVSKRYHAGLFSSAREALSEMITDYWFRCATMMYVNSNGKLGLPAYAYRFDHAPSFKELWPQFGLPTACEDKVCHMAEIPFVFNNYANYTADVTAEERSLSASLGEFFTSFVVDGKPSSKTAAADWMPHSATNRDVTVLNTGSAERPQVDQESVSDVCGFWDSIGFMHATAPSLALV